LNKVKGKQLVSAMAVAAQHKSLLSKQSFFTLFLHTNKTNYTKHLPLTIFEEVSNSIKSKQLVDILIIERDCRHGTQTVLIKD